MKSKLVLMTLCVVVAAGTWSSCAPFRLHAEEAESVGSTGEVKNEKRTGYPVTEIGFTGREGVTIGLANIRNFACSENDCDASIEQNKRKLVAVIDQLKEYGVNIILFPEFSLTGYFWKEDSKDDSEQCWRYMRKGVLDRHKTWLKKEVKAKLDGELRYIVFNSIRDNPQAASGSGKFLNSTYVIDKDFDCDDFAKDEKTHIYDKTFLPGIEKTYTTAEKRDYLVVKTEWGNFGFTTCYDMCFSQLYQEYNLVRNVHGIFQLASWRGTGAREYDLVCSGKSCGKADDHYYGFIWDLMIADRAATNQIWVIGANAVGDQEKGDYNFWGGSGVWAPSGMKIVEASNADEELVVIKNIPVKEEVKKEHEDFDYRRDFDRIYEPIPDSGGCVVKGCDSFTRWEKL